MERSNHLDELKEMIKGGHLRPKSGPDGAPHDLDQEPGTDPTEDDDGPDNGDDDS